MEKLNLLYCFDKNYNIQTIVSIDSICRNIKDFEINIYIIHDEPETFDIHKRYLNKYKNLNTIEVFKFNQNTLNFPNLVNKHVSAATYFRLFITEFIPSDIKYLIYLDSDVFCFNNPLKKINNIFDQMEKNKKTIAASTEIIKKNKDHDLFLNLQLVQNSYFNAGVMFIDYQKWQRETSINEFIALLEKYKDKIIFWDQDILNKKFDGNYLELDEKLNYRKITNNNIEDTLQENYFIHFVGNNKPWTIEAGCDNLSKVYFENYEKIYGKKYHFKNKDSKSKSLSALFKNIVSFNFLNAKYPIRYITESLKTILLK